MNEDQSEAPKPPEWRVPGDEQLETGAYHVWKPRPLLRSIHWKPVPAPEKDSAAGSYDVFVDQRAFKSIHQHVWNASPTEEPFGFLVGDLCEDPDTGRRYVIVSAAVPSKFALAEDSDHQIPGEAIVAMQLEVDRRRGILAGWYHRHRSGEPALTTCDLATHQKHFGEPWHIALLFVTDDERPAGACFRRTRHGLDGGTPLSFYEMVSNESLLARGVRRSFMDWANVETGEAIEVDAPARPDKPEEAPQTLVPEPELAPTLDVVPDGESDPAAPDLEVGEPEDAGEPGLEPEPVDELPVVLDDLLDEAIEAEAASLPPASDLEDDLVVIPEVDLVDEGLLDLSEAGEVGGDLLDLPEVGAVDDDPDASLDDLLEDEFEGLPEPIPVVDDLDDLPEPEWDDAAAVADVSLPLAADLDLESFVTEPESPMPTPTVDGELDLDEVEPDWDEPVDEVPEPADTLDEPEPEAIARPDKETPRSRRAAMAAILLVVVAIAVSLVVFVLPSIQGGGVADPAASGDTPASTSNEAGGAGSPAAGDVTEGGGDPGLGEPAGELAVADSTQPESTIQDLERLGDTLLEAVSRFYGLAVAVDGGTATCTQLAASYVEVEDLWIDYNVRGRARFRGRLPEELATRDERLYAGVQDVEREYTRSGCPRP